MGAAIERDGVGGVAAGARRVGDAQEGAGRFVADQLIDAGVEAGHGAGAVAAGGEGERRRDDEGAPRCETAECGRRRAVPAAAKI